MAKRSARGQGKRWRPYGDHGALIELESLAEVHALHRSVQHSQLAVECVPGAITLYVKALDERMSAAALVELVFGLPPRDLVVSEIRTHSIAVVYDGDDLADVARLTDLSVDEVIARHAAPTYTVAFLGFSRSFPYLVGLDPQLVVPRLPSPRTSVPAGSVGMGAGFTGIYPAASPGGWRLLGRTDDVVFNETNDPPSVLRPGDLVRFEVRQP